MKKKWKKGSITVEASFLVPMAVTICALVIFYCCFEHNLVWYTSAAYEAALVGTQRTETGVDREALARVRVQERQESQPFPGSEPEWSVTGEKRKSTVSCRSSGGLFFSEWFSFETVAEVEQTDPVGWVRTAWIVKSIMKGG